MAQVSIAYRTEPPETARNGGTNRVATTRTRDCYYTQLPFPFLASVIRKYVVNCEDDLFRYMHPGLFFEQGKERSSLS